MKILSLVIAFVILLAFPVVFAADVPRTIVVRGYLTDLSGAPVTKVVPMTYGIYKTIDGPETDLVLEEDLGIVSVSAGVYFVELGKTAGLGDAFAGNADMYLEVRVEGTKLLPRQKIGSVPFSFVALDAVGDIHPKSVTVGATPVIDATGKWVGDRSEIGTVKSVGTAAPLSGGPIIDTGTISLPKADGTASGYLASTDFATFAGKQSRVTGACTLGTCAVSVNVDGTVNCEPCGTGDVSGVIATAPLTGGGISGDVTVGLTKATGTTDGYLSSGDWNVFNAKQTLVTGTCAAGNSIRVINPDGTVNCEANITGNAATVSNGVYTTGSYADPVWMTSLAASKITGVLPVQNGGTGTSNTLVPAGSTIAFAGANVPDGWLLCDGSAVSRTQYAALFSAVGTAWGAGDGSTTFNLPDLRGRFVRGVDSGAGRDPDAAARTAANAGGATGDAVGSVEDDAFAGHNHGVNDPGHAHDYYYSTNSSPPGLPGMDATTFTNSWSPPRISGPILPASTGVSIQTTGGSETRPVNANLNYIIKY